MNKTLRFCLVGMWLAVFVAARSGAAVADAQADCYSNDNVRRISGCSELLDASALPDDERAVVYSLRALAYAVQGKYALALPDYDEAIRIDPDFAIARNNRAWTLFKSGRAADGLPDVERALELTPASPHTYDTRAHIRQAMGRPAGAIADYERAIRFGGSRMIKLYQCGLQAQGLFDGDIDGRYSPAFQRALETCTKSAVCDPLPPDEECQKLTS